MMNSSMERQAGDGRGEERPIGFVGPHVGDLREGDICNIRSDGCTTLRRSVDGRLQETRFSLPSNMFCHNDLGIASVDAIDKGDDQIDELIDLDDNNIDNLCDDLTGITKFTTSNRGERGRQVNRRG